MRHPSPGVIATVKPNPTARVDIARRYLLPAGARVIQRAPDCVQIGTEAPRRVIVQDAPPNAVRVLCRLDGSGTVADVLDAQDADPLLWGDVLDQLLDAELLVALDPLDRSTAPILRHPQLAHERSGVAHRYGEAAANRIMQARDDAMVVVRGGSDLAGSIAAMLAAAGVGHLHLERAGSAHAPANRFAGNGARSGPVGPAELRASYPNLRVHPPAAHQRPTIVVLCGDPVPDLGLAATYTRNLIPHLPVTTGLARAVVGPLVLPGRSSCLSCADRHRTAAIRVGRSWPGTWPPDLEPRPHSSPVRRPA